MTSFRKKHTHKCTHAQTQVKDQPPKFKTISLFKIKVIKFDLNPNYQKNQKQYDEIIRQNENENDLTDDGLRYKIKSMKLISNVP